MKFQHLSQYITYAVMKLRELGLPHWRVRWMGINSVRTCGRAMYGIQTIELNKDYYYLTPDHHELIDTILHEIAHALHYHETGKTGHTEGWRRVCVRIGAEPNRLTEDAVMPTIATRKISDNRAKFEID